MKKYLEYIKEESGYKDKKGVDDFLNDLKNCPYDKINKIFERTFFVMDDLRLLKYFKKFFSSYTPFKYEFDTNTGLDYAKKNQGIAYYKQSILFARWGPWEDLLRHEEKHYNKIGQYTSLWDYVIKISDFINVINSLPEKFDPIKTKLDKIPHHISLIDPYDEDDWGYDD